MAVFAVLLVTLAPALSHALQSQPAQGWLEVCSSLGTRWVRADDAAAPAKAPPGLHALEHCPYCSLNADLLGLPPGASVALAAPHGAGAVAPLFLHGPRSQYAWSPSQPRGPPAIA